MESDTLAHALIATADDGMKLFNGIFHDLSMSSATTRELLLATSAGDRGFADVTVRDTGSGIPPHIAMRLLQPFQTTKDKGMGIGLTICRSIVDAYGGRIWLLDDLPTGTGFRFQLPRAVKREAAA